MNLRKLMKQAQEMQDKMQRELGDVIVESSVGGGMVTMKMNGHKELLSVTIDAEVVDPEEIGVLQDLIVAGVNDASRRIEETMREKMGNLTSSLPGLF
jgi:DNA-binding YbaB/EbfC family protein